MTVQDLARVSSTLAAASVAGRPRLSIVAPCYNEAACLSAFVSRMEAAARACMAESYELILVNDGSADATWAVIGQAAARSANVVGVNLSRNHGHQLAVTAGLDLSRGDRVLIIDADLQDPPELLSTMMQMMDAGADVVFGRRRVRRGESAFKLATAKAFYRLLSSITEVDIPQDVGDFRLLTRDFVERLKAMPEQDRFLRGMVAWLGGRQVELLYDRDPRHGGASGYSFGKMMKLAAAGMTSFSTAPLKLAVILSTLGAVLGLIIVPYALIGFVTGGSQRGWTSLALITIFFGVGQFGCLAIIGAYVGRIFMQVKGRPLYQVGELIRRPDV